MPAPLTFFFAFLAVLALIGLAAWLVRRFAGSRLGTSTNRGRMPRLAVIDAAAVDGRRRLVLVRRDNIEHLLMIGGPTDIVVESNIVRAMPAREQLPPRVGAEQPPAPPRIAPLPDAPSWSDTEMARAETPEVHEPMPELPPQRPPRPAFPDELRRPAPVAERRSDFRAEPRGELPERREPLTAFVPAPPPDLRQDGRQDGRQEGRQDGRQDARLEPRLEPRPERAPPRGEALPTMPRALRPAEPSRLPELPKEPAKEPPRELSRELPRDLPRDRELPRELTREVPRPVLPRAERAPERAIVPPPPPPQVAPAAPPPQQSAEANLAEMAQRLEAALRRPSSPEPQAPALPQEPTPRPAARNEPPPIAPSPPVKSSFENLEDEMASLLGRPKSSQ